MQAVPRVRRFVRHFEFKPAPVPAQGHAGRRWAPGAVGTMFPQPRVSVAGEAAPVRLDDVLGAGFAVLGPSVSAATVWTGPPAVLIRVLPPGFRRRGRVRCTGGRRRGRRLTAWFAKHRAEVAVLRPDRFVYAAALDAPLDELTARKVRR